MKKRVEIISRAGKANSKLWNACYNTRDLDDGVQEWINLKEYEDFEPIEEDVEILLVNATNDEVIKAKESEIRNWKENDVMEEVEKRGRKGISTRWVITEKIKDGKKICKARLVARGFEEKGVNEGNEAPTCAAEALKVTLGVIKRKGWECESIDIKTAYLQGEKLERTVYIQPPKEAETKKLWRLKKAVYGLKDAAKVWYFSLKRILESLGGVCSKLEPSIFKWTNEREELFGIMVCHVDDICYGGSEKFRKEVIGKLKKKLKVGNMESKQFKYIGVQINDVGNGVELEQNNYRKTLNIPNKKNFEGERNLNEKEKTEYRSGIGQLNWLSQQTRPDVTYQVSVLGKKMKNCGTSDMKKLIKVMKRASEEDRRIKIDKLKGQIIVKVFADASFNGLGTGESQIGFIVILEDREGNKAPVIWKSKVANRVVRSPLEAEAMSMCDGLEMGLYIKKLWEEITKEKDAIVIGYSDSKSLEEAVKSNTNVQSRRLRVDLAVVKELLREEEVNDICWINGKNQIADELTKEGNNKNGLYEYLKRRED